MKATPSARDRDWIERIIDEVELETGVSIDDILGNTRKREVVEARRKVMYIAYSRGMSSTRIGAAMNRDHTTVLAGLATYHKSLGDEKVLCPCCRQPIKSVT